MKYDQKIIDSAKSLLRESQEERFPYFINENNCYGLKIQVNKHVFSPKHFSGYHFFISHFPKFKNKTVLEIGCGHGIISCYLTKNGAKKVLATDINSYAVKNTKTNAELNHLNNIEVRESDVFENINESEKFDIIFWNTPWAIVPKNFKMNPEDYGGFDPEYTSISKYLLEGKNYLTKNGALYLGFGFEGADIELIEKLIQEANLKKEIVADDYFYPGEKNEKGELIRFRMNLLKLTPKT